MVELSEDNIVRGPVDETPPPKEGLARFLVGKMREHGDKVAEVFPELGDCSFSFSDLARRSARVAQHLSRLGLKRGDVVMVAMLSRPLNTPLMVGCIIHGAIFAPVNPSFDHHDRKHLLRLLQPKLLISENPGWFDADATYLQLTSAETDSWFDGDGVDDQTVDALLSSDADTDHLLDTTAFVLCSSGTTGFPKGVSISHRAVLQQLNNATNAKSLRLGDMAFLLITPAFWISAINLHLMAINSGCRLVIMSEFIEELVFKNLKKLKIVGTLTNPYLGVQLSRREPPPDMTPMRFIVFAGSALSTSTQQYIKERLKLVKVSQMYGMTELLLVVGDGVTPLPPGSVGKITWNVECKVADPCTGLALGPDQEGELCFRGPTVTRGYYNDPEATSRVLDSGGWFHSGDVGYYDQQGFFYVTDRINDLIKHRGEHVPSTELESLLLEHPEVMEAAVIGIPEPTVTELPRAYVALKQGATATEQDIVSFIDKTVADHKRLRGGVVFMETLPRTVTGKVNKRILREMVKKELEAKSS